MPHSASRIRLHSLANTADRKVTWLELFFDLVFVAAVSQVAEPLREHYTVGELSRFVPLFLLVWWAWTGRAVFATRFDSDDWIQRLLTFVEMFAVAIMAANARESLESRSSAGFAAAYAGVRIILLIHYWRAGSVREARPLTRTYIIGHGLAAALWLASSVMEPQIRLATWAVAFSIDLVTPWLAISHSARVPPHPAHLPERFGLFTLILLGESLVAVMRGIESHETWSVQAASTAVFGMAALFAIWWWYFDRARAAGEHHVQTRGDAVRQHIWSYAHFPLYLGIVIAGVGIQRIVTAATHESIASMDRTLLFAAGTLLAAAMAAITRSAGSRSTTRMGKLALRQA
jgi:low temperature requirement protein LtrA